MKKNQIYFENLDMMRFVAAYLVLLSHVELTMGLMGGTNAWSNPWSDLEKSRDFNLWSACNGNIHELMHALSHEMGAMAVVFFFVLSGFLITLLLLREQDLTGRIDIKGFYIRRVLRIWPLYFLVVILCLYVLPHLGDTFYVEKQTPNLSADWKILDLPYLLILPNLSNGLMNGALPPNIGQAWSIGVEEQFYLFWPWLFLLLRAKPKWLSLFVFFVLMVKTIALQTGWPRWLQIFLVTMKFESMAIGGIGAYVFHTGWTKSISIQIWRVVGVAGALGVVLTFWLCPQEIQDALFLVQSCLFLLVILTAVHLPSRMPKVTKMLMVWLGKRSYGIYMWHMMFLTLSVKALSAIEIASPHPVWVVFVSTGLTILASHLSYSLWELPFLRLKKKWQTTP